MSISLRECEKEVTGVVNQTLKEIFRQYFEMEIDLEKFQIDRHLSDAMTSRSTLSDKDILAIVALSVEREMMDIIIAKVFKTGSCDHNVAAQSCINEITNIVTARVKTYLNEHGFDFGMGLPEVVSSREPKPDNLEMFFRTQDNRLAIDIGMETERSGYVAAS